MIISKVFIAFMIFSAAGWIWETIYCTIKSAKWQNRGFLYGPVCPIYGVGACSALLAMHFFPQALTVDLPLWALFLICAVASAILEYLTSWLLEKLFGARWWDYSDMPLQLNGRICLPASALFGLAGVCLVRWLLPWSRALSQGFLRQISPLVFEAAALLLMALFAADFVLTIANISQLLGRMNAFEEEFTAQMEARYAVVGDRQRWMAERMSALSDELTFRQKYIIKNVQRRTKDLKRDMLETLRAGLLGMPHIGSALKEDERKAKKDEGS